MGRATRDAPTRGREGHSDQGRGGQPDQQGAQARDGTFKLPKRPYLNFRHLERIEHVHRHRISALVCQMPADSLSELLDCLADIDGFAVVVEERVHAAKRIAPGAPLIVLVLVELRQLGVDSQHIRRQGATSSWHGEALPIVYPVAFANRAARPNGSRHAGSREPHHPGAGPHADMHMPAQPLTNGKNYAMMYTDERPT